jgi:hypothetical protein
LRSLQEIQPDFEEEAKVYAGLWSQGKKERKKERKVVVVVVVVTFSMT